MNTPTDDELHNSKELMDRITAGVTKSSRTAVINARMHNSKIISWRDGEIVEIDPFSIVLDDDLKN